MEKAGDQSSNVLIFAVVFFVISLLTTLIVAGLYLNNNIGKSCTFNGATYKEGEGFMNDCNSCSCTDGEVSCTTMACEGVDFVEEFLDEEEFIDDEIIDGEEVVGLCLENDVFYEEGEEFTKEDGAVSCVCTASEIVCEDVE
jgi:hypothetical protein